MGCYSDGFYEIEYQRMYRKQRRLVMYINYLKYLLRCRKEESAQLRAQGFISLPLQDCINVIKYRLKEAYILRNYAEVEKKELSLGGGANAKRQNDAMIIKAAYERAYANKARSWAFSKHRRQK